MPEINNVTTDKDFELVFGQNYNLTESNDLQMVSGNRSVVYSLIRRILVVRGTWPANTDFGSNFQILLQTKGVNTITDSDIREVVVNAALPMIEDQRIQDISQVVIENRTTKGITVRLEVIINEELISTNFVIPTS